MTRKQRLRRVAILCCNCLRNLAFYRAGWRNSTRVFKGHFWANVNGNFLDICVLEWCKLFGDSRGRHYFGKVLTAPTDFFDSLLNDLRMNEAKFDAYVREMKTYRDKFVAHLDSEPVMHIPDLTVALKSVSLLYDYLRAHEDHGGFFPDAPENASAYYASSTTVGREGYGF